MKEIKLSSKIINDKYTQYVYDTYDIQKQNLSTVSIPFDLKGIDDFQWNIGVILGGSGSGKSTVLNNIGTVKDVQMSPEKCLISNFDFLPPEEASLVLTSMGLSTIPAWLRPFNVLSNGEKYRAKLAYLVANAKDGDVILVDEYTSVVDRNVAKSMSFALQKYIRRKNKKIILASCHYDILEWLMPDWTCSLQKGGVLEKGDWLRQGRPKIELCVSRVEFKAWDIFKKHHYLTQEVNKTSKFFLFEWNNAPVGIIAVLPSPGANRSNAVAFSRTVVLPDYQGMGIGQQMCNFIASIFKNNGNRIYGRTINPALGIYRNNSPLWKGTGTNGKRANVGKKSREYGDRRASRLDRVSYSHEYIGEGVSGYDDLIISVKELRKKKKYE
jgi:ABC-type lipoprotein export system ATPase subunit/GNAT superfamily N-acetyltransferase